MTIPEGFEATQAISKAVDLEASRKQKERADKDQELLKKRVDARAEEVVDSLRAAAGWKHERNGRSAPVVALGQEKTAEHGVVSIVGVVGIRGISSYALLGVVFDNEGNTPDINLCRLGVTSEGRNVMGLLCERFSSYQQYQRGGYWDRVSVQHLESLESTVEAIIESAQDPVLNPSLVGSVAIS